MTAKQSGGRRPRLAPWKFLTFMGVLLLLSPFLICYGLVGAVLKQPASTLAVCGVALLTALEVLMVLQMVQGTDPAFAAVDSGGTAWRLRCTLLAWIAINCLSPQLEYLVQMQLLDRLGCLYLCAWLAPLVAAVVVLIHSGMELALGWEWLPIISAWVARIPTSIAVTFAVVHLSLPRLVALGHEQVWIPARYSELERLERKILARNVHVPYKMTKVAGLGTIHVQCTTKDGAARRPPLVLVHGFAAGNALWACNLEELAKCHDVYAVEWLGTGRSDRPAFSSYELEDADSMFVGALERWREELKLNTFYLGGHSLGALFCGSYAVQYPSRVKHLVLISPAGVGLPPPVGPLPLGIRIFRAIWGLRLTPMSVARFAGPLGPALLRFIASARTKMMPETSCIRRGLLPVDMLAAYWYHNWALTKSGEIAMHSHLLPGVFAKRPLCEMLTPESIKAPITFLYGGGADWMSSSHGEKLAESFVGKQRVQVLLVEGAGHQVFLDNAQGFNRTLLAALSSC